MKALGDAISTPAAFFCLQLLALVHPALAQTQTPDVRLVGGRTPLEGRVELLLPSGQWLPVCGTSFNLAAASVVCRSLGFSFASSTSVGSSAYGVSNSTAWVQGITCFGTESSLSQCARSPLSSSTCGHSLDVGVQCAQLSSTPTTAAAASTTAAATTTPTGTRNTGSTATAAASTAAAPPSGATVIPAVAGCTPSADVALRDGANAAIGRVQVRLNNIWGTVCANRGFDTNEATVICRQLCYNPAYARAILPTNTTVFASSSVPIVMDNVACTGTEASLTSCAYDTAIVTNCTHRSDAMVSCVNYILGPPSVPVANVACSAVGAVVTFNIVGDASQLSAGDVYLQQYSSPCSPTVTVNQSAIVLQFAYPGCMSASSSNNSHIIYSASIVYNQRGLSNNVITRNSQFVIPVVCLLVRQTDVQGGIIPQVQTAPPVSNLGTYSVSMVLYTDASMQVPITSYPVNITLGDYLTVGVNLAADGNGLQLVLPYCYATSALNSGVKYVLLNQKCGIDPTVQIFSINQTMVAFRFQVFTFPSAASVYIHCEARVCAGTEVTTDCDRTCYSRRKRQTGNYITYSVYKGPLILQPSELQLASEGGSRQSSSSSATSPIATRWLLGAIALVGCRRLQ